MGRGKKKGKKEQDDAHTSEEPTTSGASVNPVVDSDAGGLTGSKEKTPETQADKTPTIQKQEEKKEEPDEDTGGLGLDGGRRRNPRKKKKPTDAAAAKPVETTPTAAGVTTPIATPGPSTVAPSEQMLIESAPPAPAQWGAGRGRGRGRGRGQGRGADPNTARPIGVQPSPMPQPSIIQTPPSFTALSTPSNKQLPAQSLPRTGATPGYSGDGAGSSHGRGQPYTETAKKIQDMPLCRYKIPDKIIGRTVPSRQVKVLTNYLAMTIQPLKIHRYDVAFKPERPKKLLPTAFMIAKDRLFPKDLIAFDQMKNCYSLYPLKNITSHERLGTTVVVKDNNEKAITFEVSLKGTGIVDLGRILEYMNKKGTSLSPPTEAIQCIDVILRQGTLEKYVKAGRQFFKRPAHPYDLGDGLEMWTGLFQSAIFTSRAFVNIDVAHKGFPKNLPLIEIMKNDFGFDLNRPIDQQFRSRDSFKSFIKGLKVMATVFAADGSTQKREFICNDVVDTADNLSFIQADPQGKDRRITVADYFKLVKRYTLKYPKLNCMWVGPREKSIYYPIELLVVAYGQARMRQLNDMQLAKMVTKAATPPDVRKSKIQEVIADMKYSKNPEFKKFGLEISDEFFPVDAKVLQPPVLEVGDRQTVMPRNGTWQAKGLLKPETLRSWGFIAIETDPRHSEYEKIITMILDCGRQMGMTVEQPKMHHFNVKMQDLQKLLFTALEKEIKFLFVIVSTRGRDYYHRVKRMAELDVGILTQCIKEYTAVQRMNIATVRNILLKVNSKLMGVNQALDGRCMPKCLKGGGVMIVGADVTHPSPEQTSIPSIAAVTASIDPKCYVYNVELSVQTPKKEMIVEFEDMMVDHLMAYKAHQGMLPKKIYVFRDGVSEGQFAQVLNSELTAVHRAYERMTGSKQKPEVLFLLVQKRHHTRLFQTQNIKYNVEPGTVVDTEIVHARELDFYLVSHQAIKGTARPTRYHAVCNDGGVPHDEVEQLTYYLCHLYARCMRAVSYPTPTYYAHLACLRARSLTFGDTFDNAQLERKPKRLNVHKKMHDLSRMFFI